MTLLRTSFYTSISQALSIIAGLISIKVVSLKIGPEGMAMMGQYLNTTALLSLFATGAIGTGVVKYLAEYKENKQKQLEVIATASRITIISTLIIALIAIILSGFFSRQAFKTENYYSVYILWGLFLVFTSLAALMSNVLNGLKLIPYLTIVNITGTITGLLVTIFLAYSFGVYGVLIAANFTAFILFCIHLFFINKYKWFSFRELILPFDKKTAKLLTAFVLMTLVSGVLAPAIQLLVRDRIIDKFSFEEAGYWQSVTRISDYYLSFITSVIGVYYLPRLAEIDNNRDIKKEIWKMYRVILPVIAAVSFLIWLSRFLIIKLILTPEFLPSAELYGIQFMGDFFKIAAWLLAYVMLAKAMKYKFIVTEFFFSISYVLLCFFLIDKFGLIGATYGFLLNNFLLWVLMVFFIKRYVK
jgi:O-antigen/teichoic acid export membrane protein